MNLNHRDKLRDFYDQALLSPELMCLCCGHTAWNRAACRCSAERKEDCLLFAGEMVNRLSAREFNQGEKAGPQAGKTV